MRFLLGFILGLLLFPAGVFVWYRTTRLPVAVTDATLPFERDLARRALHARIDAEAPASAPIEPSQTNLRMGAQVYRENCAACHGYYGRPAPLGANMFPSAPQLWAPHGHGIVGVSDDPVGETYWKVSNGIRLSGMPAFGRLLTPTQMWQVSLLLASADKPLPSDALAAVKPPSEESRP